MKEECRGCHLIRIIIKDGIITYHPDQISCENEEYDCPCKTCLVKSMCDIIENGMKCEVWVDFNTKYGTNEFWIERRENGVNIKTV